MMETKAERKSNIELLRIICMVAIIVHHCVSHGGGLNMEMCGNRIIAMLLYPGGKIGFDCFLAISTWFLVDSKFKAIRFFRLWFEVFFYSVVFAVISMMITSSLTVKGIFSAMFPISGISHGFASSYLLLYLLLPFLSKVTENITRKQARILVIILFYVQVISKIIGYINGYSQPIASEILLFVLFYFTSLNLKRWPVKIQNNKNVNIFIVAAVWILVSYCFYLSAVGRCDGILEFIMAVTIDESSLLYIIAGYALFFLFLNREVKYSPLINTVAKTTFGVLLIHDHSFFRYILWNNILKTSTWYYSDSYLLNVVICVFLIYVTCSCIDILRKQLIEEPILRNNIIQEICGNIDLIVVGGNLRDNTFEPYIKENRERMKPKVEREYKETYEGVYCQKTDSINILRLLAVLCVFFLHTSLFSGRKGFLFDNKTWIMKTPAWAAVWIFFLISGYTVGKGFLSGRYKENQQYTPKCILDFYIKRFKKIVIPTWCFCFISIILLCPEFFLNCPESIFKILSFTYFNNPSSDIIGATWYVNTLVWLYICAPFLTCFIEWLIKKISNEQDKHFMVGGMFVIIVFLGASVRLVLLKQGLDWSSQIYVPFYCNLDIYLCGILLNYFNDIDIKDIGKKFVLSLSAVCLLIIANCRIYYLGDFQPKYMWFYQYILPSVYILVIGMYLLYATKYDSERDSVEKEVVIWRIINWFTNISFEFYLVHSMVLNQIVPYVNGSTTLWVHIKLLVYAFVVSAVLSYIIHCTLAKQFSEKRRKNAAE